MDEVLGVIETEDGLRVLKQDSETGYRYTEVYIDEDDADALYQAEREYSF